ncbi:MAG: MBL fold metallo-hydrolase [Rhodospirillales bacterium]
MGFDFKEGGLETVGDGIFVYVGPEGDSNNGIIVTEEGVVSIDSFIRNYDGWMNAYKKVSDRPVRLAINTHDDGDHFTMNHIFRRQGAFIVASEVCRDRIDGKMHDDFWIDDLKRRNPALAHEASDPTELIPHIGLKERATLKLAGEKIDLIHMGHGHCPGDMVVNFPERGVLFAGDLVFAGVHGRLKTADIGNLIVILDQLLEIPCETVVPGHGRPIKGLNNEVIETFKDYLITLSDRIAELIGNGIPSERLQAELQEWEYYAWARPTRIPFMVENVYQDVKWRGRFTKKAGFRDHMGS